MPFKIIRNDITKVKTDAIVNAANPTLEMGGGVCGAIFIAAGIGRLQKECCSIGGCETGKAVITKGYNLPARYVIHTVGPIWNGGGKGEPQQLYNCYKNSMELALKHKLKSIAFPLISSGIFGYPKEAALNTAISAIGDFLEDNEMMVYLVVFDRAAYKISEKRLYEVKKYIDDNYVDEHYLRFQKKRTRMIESEDSISVEYAKRDSEISPLSIAEISKRSLNDVVGQLDESFSEMLLRIIDEKGMTDVETYKKANISRKLFSTIRTKKEYKPSFITAVAFAIALNLSIDETQDLLGKASYILSDSSEFDMIIKYFISNGIYDIYEINETLFAFDQVLLGA